MASSSTTPAYRHASSTKPLPLQRPTRPPRSSQPISPAYRHASSTKPQPLPRPTRLPRSSQPIPPALELGPDFCGPRSTCMVSKRNLTRPRHSTRPSAPPSASALDCLSRLAHDCPDDDSTRDLLESFDLLLSGTDDYGFLICEIGARGGDCRKVLQCFRFAMPRMRSATERGKLLIAVIGTLGKLARPDLARELFDAGILDGYGSTVYAYSALITAYARNGMSAGALALFDSMKSAGIRPDSVTFSALIDACVKGGEDFRISAGIFSEMLRCGVRPVRITFTSFLAAYCRAGRWDEARAVIDEMIRLGIGRDVVAYSTFIDAVCKSGNMDLAVDILAEMRSHDILPNVVTYNTLIDGYSKLDRFDDALRLLDEMRSLSIPMDCVSFNILLSIYIRMGRFDDVIRTTEEMERLGIDRNVATYNSLLVCYGKQSRFEVVSYLIQSMRSDRIVMNVFTYSILIDIYSKGGMYQKAMEIYMEFRDTGLKANIVLYNTLIDTLCRNGRVESAVGLLSEMIRVGIRPNVVTFNSIINAFAGTATVDDAATTAIPDRRLAEPNAPQRSSQELFCILELFRRMHSLGIRPDIFTFSSILNACSRCNSFEDASLLLEQLRDFDGVVYGVAHGLLMGSKEVWPQASMLFDELKRMSSSTASAFYNALTDMLWHFGQRRGAQLVVMEGRRRNAWETTWTDSSLDLHLMSPGAAQAMVHAWLLSVQSVVYEGRQLPIVMSILTGWGKHSKVSGSGALRRSIQALLASLDAPFHVERSNMGRFVSNGVDVAMWLLEACDVTDLILHDVRIQSENQGFAQQLPPDLQLLKL